jgi:hypothetical protein
MAMALRSCSLAKSRLQLVVKRLRSCRHRASSTDSTESHRLAVALRFRPMTLAITLASDELLRFLKRERASMKRGGMHDHQMRDDNRVITGGHLSTMNDSKTSDDRDSDADHNADEQQQRAHASAPKNCLTRERSSPRSAPSWQRSSPRWSSATMMSGSAMQDYSGQIEHSKRLARLPSNARR